MLLEKKILALKEELEQREAAMQVREKSGCREDCGDVWRCGGMLADCWRWVEMWGNVWRCWGDVGRCVPLGRGEAGRGAGSEGRPGQGEEQEDQVGRQQPGRRIQY